MRADALMALLAADSERQERVAERQRALAERTGELREAEAPIVADLAKAGVDVASVWDLVNTSEPYPNALPVLMDHLRRGGYPDRVMESLGRALAVKPSARYWHELVRLYRNARSDGEEDGVAVAIAASATPEVLDDLIGLLSLDERGNSRIYFIGAIRKVGGNRGRQLVEGLKSHPVFGKEARAKSRNVKSRS